MAVQVVPAQLRDRLPPTRETVALVIVHFVESLGGIRAVQAFRREPRNQEIFETLNYDYRLANERAFKLVAIFAPGIKLIGNVTVAVVLVYGGYRVMGGQTEVGVLAAFLLYLRRFFEPMQELSMFYNSLQSATAALEKLSGVLDEKPAVAEPEHPVPLAHIEGRVDLDNVRFGYRDAIVLPGLDLHIPAGQTVAMVGATGAGKTTIARLVARFYDPLDRVGAARRGRPARPLRAGPAARGRHGDPGELPVRRHGRREHPVRPAGRERGRRRSRRRRRSARTTSSQPCPTATTPTSASAAGGCRPGSGSWSPSPERSSATRQC